MKTIGARMLEARQLTKMHQMKAATLLGIEKSQLQEIEHDFPDSLPLSLVLQASKIYDVSMDYLFGISDDWEQSPDARKERDFLSHIESLLAETQAKAAAEIIRQQAQINTLVESVRAMAPAIDSVQRSMDRFIELNDGFPDMPAGAMVLSSIKKAQQAAQTATKAMIKQKLLPVETTQ